MRDLVTWLGSQLDQDEQIAQAAADESGGPEWAVCTDGCCVVVHVPEDARLTGDDGPLVADGVHWRVVEHITRHDSASVLADIAAKRSVLQEAVMTLAFERPTDSDSVLRRAQMDYVVRLLATAYADHDGYREEWRGATPEAS